jgi:hypothetical protein
MDIEPIAAEIAQKRFGKDRAGGIAGADEQDAESRASWSVGSGSGEVEGRAEVGPAAAAIANR